MLHKILITGSNGLLGQKLVNLISEISSFNVIATSKGSNRNNTAKNFKYHSLDITDTQGLIKLIDKEEPTYVINCAAMTNVDQCETEKDLCDKINVKAVETLVACAKKKNFHLIHISTDFIFDGTKGPYTETDIPKPISYYGLSKLKSETSILKASIKFTILRTILVYGLVDNMTKGNIVLFVKNALEQHKEVTMVDDQFRMPTLVDDLAQACLSAIQVPAYGIYNVSSNKLLSIYEMALEIAATFNLDGSYIKRIKTSQLNQPAKRPERTGFVLDKSQKDLDFPIADFKNRLQVFKKQLLSQQK